MERIVSETKLQRDRLITPNLQLPPPPLTVWNALKKHFELSLQTAGKALYPQRRFALDLVFPVALSDVHFENPPAGPP